MSKVTLCLKTADSVDNLAKSVWSFTNYNYTPQVLNKLLKQGGFELKASLEAVGIQIYGFMLKSRHARN